jgi:hypothetical protein
VDGEGVDVECERNNNTLKCGRNEFIATPSRVRFRSGGSLNKKSGRWRAGWGRAADRNIKPSLTCCMETRTYEVEIVHIALESDARVEVNDLEQLAGRPDW